MAQFCKECGSPIEPNVRFCPGCGKPVAETEAPQNAAPEAARQQRSNMQYQRVFDERKNMQKMDWSQFKPKVTIGKPQITFISKRKLIIAGIIIVICILIALLQGCDTVKGTSGSSGATAQSKSSNSSVSVSRVSKTNVLKNTSTEGVKSFTLSDVNSKTLSREETKELDNLAREIKEMGNCQVTVIGHADNTGMAEVNETVSVNRARLVADYLKKKGVTNIITSGESYNHPLASNDTAAGRAKNRRVEIFVSTIGKYNPYK